ncbi:hypothetical protein Taro_009180 [Colocasia esculenta]|uniref:Uncharacterized protein n=1 Tax=Colocasia esculenta TaxID=4460 RepID=A0A843U976_COLES|nr:hypothetical protein [Colocasia esculenta]
MVFPLVRFDQDFGIATGRRSLLVDGVSMEVGARRRWPCTPEDPNGLALRFEVGTPSHQRRGHHHEEEASMSERNTTPRINTTILATNTLTNLPQSSSHRALCLTSLRPVLWHLRACPSARCAFGLLPFPGTPILVGPLRVVSEPRVRPSSCRGAGQLVRSHCLALHGSGAVSGGQAWDRSPARLRLVVVFVHASHSDGRGDLDSWSSGLCSREPVLVFVRSALCRL